MKFSCLHCSQPIEIDDADVAAAAGASIDIECPSCGQSMPLPDVSGDAVRECTPEEKAATTLPAATELSPEPPGPKPSADLGKGKTDKLSPARLSVRNIRILGAAALVVLGGVALYLASRPDGNTTVTNQKIVRRFIQNEYFQRLIREGKTSEKALEAVEEAFEYGGGFIGVSAQPVGWDDAARFADERAAAVLDVAIVARESRKELGEWIAKSFPSLQGQAVAVLDQKAAAAIDAPDVLRVSADRPRRILLRWPANEIWSNKGWMWTIKPAGFDAVEPFQAIGLARVKSGGKWGLIDRTGKWATQPENDEIERFSAHESAAVRKGDKWGLVDATGRVVVAPEWNEVQDLIHGFIPVQRGGKWGYLDATGKQVIAPEWDDAWRFNANGQAVVTRGGRRGFIDRAGKVFVQPVWDGAINLTSDGIGAVRRGNRWGLVDSAGAVFTNVDLRFRWQERFLDLGVLGAASSDAVFTVMDLDGKALPQFADATALDSINSPGGPLLRVTRKDGSQSLVQRDGREIFRTQGKGRIEEYSSDLALVKDSRGTAFIDALGKITIPFSPDERRSFVGELSWFISNGKTTAMNKRGELLPLDFDEIRGFCDYRAPVRKGSRWGFIDTQAHVVINPAWLVVTDFQNGIAAVTDSQPPKNYRQQREWAMIDKQGRILFMTYTFGNSVPRFVHFGGGELMRGHEAGKKEMAYFDREGKSHGSSMHSMKGGLPPGWSAFDEAEESLYWNRYTTKLPPSYGNAVALSLRAADGSSVMPGVNERQPVFDDFIPYSPPPKYGLIDATGKMLVEPTWDGAEVLSKDWVRIRAGSLFGLADGTGKVIVKPEWDEIKVPQVTSASLAKDGKTLLLGGDGTRFLAPWILAKKGGKVTVLKPDGKPALPASLAAAEYVDFYGPSHLVLRVPDATANRSVLSIYEPATDDLVRFPLAASFIWNWSSASAGMVWMRDTSANGKLWKLMTRKGREVGFMKPEDPWGWGFMEDRAIVANEKGESFIDSKGNIIGEGGWQDARDFSEGLAAVKRDGKWGFIDLNGKLVTEMLWQDARDFHHGRAAVQSADNGWWGFIDASGKLVSPAIWTAAEDYRDWTISGTGKSISVLQRERYRDAGEWKGVALPQKTNAQETSRPIARVSSGTWWTLVDLNGMPIIDLGATDSKIWLATDAGGQTSLIPFAWYSQNKNRSYGSLQQAGIGTAWQRVGSDWQLIDHENKPLTTPTWTLPYFDLRPDPFGKGLLSIRSREGFYGLVQPDGKIVAQPRFERIAWVAPGIAAAWSATDGGLIGMDGNWIFKDDASRRIARFGTTADRSTDATFRHGLVVIEDLPQWGYARLNRP